LARSHVSIRGFVKLALLGVLCTQCSVSGDSGCKEVKIPNPFDPNPPRPPEPAPFVELVWQQNDPPTCRCRLTNRGNLTARALSFKAWHCDSIVVIRPPGDTLGPGQSVVVDVPPRNSGGTPICPLLADLEWIGGRNTGVPSSLSFQRTNLAFWRWERVDESVAVGWVVNETHADADSIVVVTQTRDGIRANATTPTALYQFGQEAQFISAPGDSAGVAVAPHVLRITWKDWCGADSTAYAASLSRLSD
jgi:hypothetical protein